MACYNAARRLAARLAFLTNGRQLHSRNQHSRAIAIAPRRPRRANIQLATHFNTSLRSITQLLPAFSGLSEHRQHTHPARVVIGAKA